MGAYLSNIDLTQANLGGADIRGVDISKAIVAAAKIDQARHTDKRRK